MTEPAHLNPRYPFSPYPNGWFRAAYSHELDPGEVKTLGFFGQELVLFRTEGGEARLFDPFCPHLGAHLGFGGQVDGESLRCPFHHWEFDGEGRCSHIPYAKRIPAKAKIRSWPVVERYGLIFFWHHRDGEAPSFEIPEIPEIGDTGWTTPDIMHWQVRANWLDMNENCVDQAHFKFIHGTRTIPPTTARAEGHLHVAESIFTMTVPGGEAEATLVTLDYGPGLQLVRISGLIDTLMINTSTPMDAENTDVSFCYTVRAEGETRKMHLAEAVVKDLKQQFEHDRPIWENKAHWERPVLCDGDGPIPGYRKWYRQFV
jgi:phenylpropionate dioxygenase-like ring-hydroxylating dioxygenase large terminal subunit